ncbi:MAG TPA: endonuclease III [Patescibacteria group bacterium]|nr:endonuclease III [Patescibacteria group bacterium]
MTHPNTKTITSVLDILKKTYTDHPMYEAFKHNPFQMLVAVILSQRATDAMTIPVARTLFALAPNAQTMLRLSTHELEAIIHPIGFYHAKTAALQKLCENLLKHHNGNVPSTEQELLALPQVGRKTANIMLTLFFNTPRIAVDVHVHRITHRLGWVQTKTPDETEHVLTALIPKEYIKDVNRVFVRHGQTLCKPVSPICSQCPIHVYCPRIDVITSR